MCLGRGSQARRIDLLCVPVVAWWLQVSYWQALWLDIGVLLFFLPYTWLFNWLYDHARARRARAVA